jgi:hypothetical protein
MVEPDWGSCIVCYVRHGTLTGSDVIFIMGNAQTQHILERGYCVDHVRQILEAFEDNSLSIDFDVHERVDEVFVKWGHDSAYFL